MVLSQVRDNSGSTRQRGPYFDKNFNSIYNQGKSKSLKKIFSSFSGSQSTVSSSRKHHKTVKDMARCGSKRDFKVKCMKIDLTKQLES